MACIVFSLEDGSSFSVPLDTDLLTIGRHPESMAHLQSPSVSSHHGAVRRREDGWYVQDMGSRNGTRVNGAEIEESVLKDGDRVAFGDVQAVFYAADAAPKAVAQPPVYAKAAPEPVPGPPIKKLVTQAPPVTGIPPGAGKFQPKPRPSAPRRRDDEGSGCTTAFILTLLFLGAFIIGLCLRHYQQTGGILPNDLLEKLFNKASKIHIESSEEK